MAEAGQVPGDGASTGPVGGADERDVLRELGGRVEDHERDAAGPQPVLFSVGELGDRDQAVGAAGDGDRLRQERSADE
ncbi:hypothetical protein Acsp01_57580 [Actinoplanes sp. NBRC 101535]|nr:hypothetical protein Acsp01_57580 [Actinoplanes sp. NBRC 101535]